MTLVLAILQNPFCQNQLRNDLEYCKAGLEMHKATPLNPYHFFKVILPAKHSNELIGVTYSNHQSSSVVKHLYRTQLLVQSQAIILLYSAQDVEMEGLKKMNTYLATSPSFCSYKQAKTILGCNTSL